MKKKVACAVLALCFLGLSAYAQASGSSKSSPKSSKAAKRPEEDWALIFNFDNLLAPLSPYSDGFQAGAGVKHWFTETLAGRALLYALMEPSFDTYTTTLGVSAACEFHPRTGRVSPYFGGILGCKFLFEPDQNYLDFFLGALGGVEVRIFQNFGLFAEYQALMVRDYDGFWLKFGTDAVLGLIIYF